MIEVPYSQIQYYEKKIVRLEGELSVMQEELTMNRIKVSDYEEKDIKNQAMIKEMTDNY